MIAIMNEKGRQTKLLAAVAILAMVVCVFAVAMPSDDVDAAVDTPVGTEAVTYEKMKAWTSSTTGNFKLEGDVTLDEGTFTIPNGVKLYTDSQTLDASAAQLIVNGQLYVNGTGGTLIIGGTQDANCIFNGKVVVDENGTVKICTTDDNFVYVGTGGVASLTTGTIEIVEKEGIGFTATLVEGSAMTLNTLSGHPASLWQTDDLVVGKNATLTVDTTVTMRGTVTNNGTITVNADKTLTNNGTFTNNGTITKNGNFTNNGTFIDNTVTASTATNAIGYNFVVTGGIVGADGWKYDSTNKTVTFTGGEISNFYFNGDISSVIVEEATTISVPATIASGENSKFAAIYSTTSEALAISGDELTIRVSIPEGTTVDGSGNSDSIAAIYVPSGNLTITCDKLTIAVTGTVTVSGDNEYSEAVYGILIGNSKDLTIGNSSNAVDLDIEVATGCGLAFAIAYGDQTYTNVTGQIIGGNRGIQIGTNSNLSFDDANLTITGGEKAIQAKSTGSSVALSNGSNITLELSDVNLNNGMNDRWGLKAVELTVGTGCTLTTDGLRITSSSSSTVNGTLHITYNAGAGLTSDANSIIFPAGLVLWADSSDNPTGGALSISIGNGGQIVVDSNNAIAGKICADTNSSATFGALVDGNLKYTTVTSAATFSYGSLDIDGGFSGDTPIQLEGNGEYEMSGTYDTPVEVGAGSGESITKVNVPSGRSSEFNKDVSFGSNTKFNGIGDVSGDGNLVPATGAVANTISITSSNPGALNDMLGGGLTATKNENTDTTDGETTRFADLIGNNAVIILTANYEVSGTETLPSTVTVYLNGYNIIIGADDVLNVNGATIREGLPSNLNGATVDSNGQEGKIAVNEDGTFSLDGADVFAPVDADSKTYIVLQNTKSVTISDGQITGPIEVGYGNTINANSITVPGGLEINVYGTLNINGTIRVANGGEFNVHQGGEAVIAGTLNIAGTANIDGKMTVEGAVSMQGSGNSTSFAVGSTGTVNVASGATFTVNRANGSYSNTLTVSTGGKFSVEGTLVMNGTLSGTVDDFGTVQINGTVASAGAIIYIYDGVSVTVTSVSGGALTISDANAIEDYTDGISSTSIGGTSDGNIVILRPGTSGTIGGITVSTAITSYISNGIGYYFTDMTVTGTVTSSVNGGSVNITGTTGNALVYNADGDTRTGQVLIGDMALGAGVVLNVNNGDVYVQGAIDATVAGNSTSGVDSPIVNVYGGKVTVEGSIKIINNDIDNTQYINAAYYTTLEGVYTYHHYTSADAAIAAIDGADQKTITLYGEVSVTTDAGISSGENVIVSNGSILYVEAVLTIEDGAYFTNSGTVEVKDTMVVINYLATYNGTAPGADVMSTDGNDRTYMSLAAALESGATAITLNRDVTIEGNVTVPEGVTVSGNGVDITVNPKATLTVDGAVELVRGDIKLVDGTSADGAMVVNGHITVQTYAPSQETIGEETVNYLDLANVVDGAFFSKRVNGLSTNFVSGIEYAASAVDDSVTQITVYGNVTTTDVTFTAGKQGLTISVVDIDTDNQSSLTVGTMTLVGATLNLVGDNNGDITGTITVQDSDGNVVGSIVADDANGFAFSAYQEIAADGTDNYAYISGVVEGKLEIVAGTVTVGPAAENTLIINDDSTVTVASEATLVVDAGVTVSSVGDGAKDDAVLIVDGTITINDTLTINGDVIVNGTMNVTSVSEGSGTVIVNTLSTTRAVVTVGELDILGTLNVEAYSTNIYGKVIVKGVMSVGSAPDSSNVGGAVSGNIGIFSGGYVKSYVGSDLSVAAFVQSNGTTYNSSTVAKSTQYLINGDEYMTVYAVGGVAIYDVILAEEFNLSGIFNGVSFENPDSNTGLYDIDSWFTDPSMEANTVLRDNENIGGVDTVYGKADAATVLGTVSEGDGLTLYIDNVPISNSSAQYPLTVGTHTVAFTVQAGYNGDNAVITFNGQVITSGGSIEITAGMETFTLTVTGATPADQTVTIDNGSSSMGLTDYLLIILVVLIAIMAIIVALRMMRS